MHTVATAAAALGSSPSAVLRACRRLGVPKLGPIYQIDAEALEAIRGLVRPGQPGCPAFGPEMGRRGGLASAAAKAARPKRRKRATRKK